MMLNYNLEVLQTRNQLVEHAILLRQLQIIVLLLKRCEKKGFLPYSSLSYYSWDAFLNFNLQAYICQGDVFLAMDKFDSAEISYSTALEIDPSIRRSKSFKVLIHLSLYEQTMGNFITGTKETHFNQLIFRIFAPHPRILFIYFINFWFIGSTQNHT